MSGGGPPERKKMSWCSKNEVQVLGPCSAAYHASSRARIPAEVLGRRLELIRCGDCEASSHHLHRNERTGGAPPPPLSPPPHPPQPATEAPIAVPAATPAPHGDRTCPCTEARDSL